MEAHPPQESHEQGFWRTCRSGNLQCSFWNCRGCQRLPREQDVHGSPSMVRGDIFTRGYLELFPAGGNLAGHGPGQTALEVKLALPGAGGWTGDLHVHTAIVFC